MAKLPVMHKDPTIDAMREVALGDAHAAEQPRRYLGMSSIGERCERKLWYSFRWSFTVSPWLAQDESQKLIATWAADDGHRTEALMAARLRKVKGIELHTLDPRTGRQIEFSYLGGHFCGHADGVVRGVLQAPKTWHVWEHKARDEEYTRLLQKAINEKGEKNALQEWEPIYYAQAVMYMDSIDMTRHYMTVSGPGGRVPAIGLRTDANPDFARALRAKAERIIRAQEPPPRISDQPAWHECKICPAWNVCHGNRAPPVSCRTCVHATPEIEGEGGRWSCAFHKIDIPEHGQRVGCDSHRFIPALIPYAKPVDADPAENWIEYELANGVRFRNGVHGPDSYESTELHHAQPWVFTDESFRIARREFGGRVAGAESAESQQQPAEETA